MLRAETAPATPVDHQPDRATGADADRTVRMHALVVGVLNALLRAGLDEIDGAIDAALAQLGAFCGVDRTYVFTCRDISDGAIIDNTHEWVAEGISSELAGNQGIHSSLLGDWWERMQAGLPIDVWDSETLPEGPLRDHILAQKIRSFLLVPMQRAGRVVGFVGFDVVRERRPFTDVEKALLSSVGDGIQSLIERRNSEREIVRTQQSLAEARNRLRAILDALPEIVLEVDSEGRYVSIHTADPGQMMVPPEALVGLSHEEAVAPEIAALNRRAMAECDRNGRSGPHVFVIDTPRGPRHYALTVSPRPPLQPGEPSGYVFVSRDVTEDVARRAETERLGLIVRRMTDLVLVIGLDNRIEWVNPAFEARTGWRLDEVRGRRPGEVLHSPGTDLAEVGRIAAEMAAGRAVRAELLNRTRSGEEFWTDIDIHPLHDADGRLTGFVSIETDITERKAQQAALARLAEEATAARERLETAVEAMPDAFAFYDAEDRLVLCNSRHRELYPRTAPLMVPGVPFERLIRAAIANGDIVVPDDDPESLLADRLKVHRTPGGAVERQHANGSWMRMLDVATHDGGRLAMAIDVTELKRAEQRLADIIHGAEVGTWEWRLFTGENLINERWAAMLGYTVAELHPLTIDVWRRLCNADDLAAAERMLAAVHAGRLDQFEYDLRMRHRDGHWVWVASRGRVVRWSADGRPEVMSGVHIDITALKRAEERLAQIIAAADAGTWEYDLKEGQTHINDRWAEMLGYTVEELSRRDGFGFRELVHPEDLAVLDRMNVETLVQGDTAFSNEIRMRHRDGRWIWVLSRGQIVAWEPGGQPARTAGIHLDITDRKRLEAQLTAERDYLARLMETSVSGIVALDAEGAIIFANREAEAVLGLDAAQISGRRFNAPSWRISTVDGGPFPDSELPFTRALSEGRTVRDIRFAIAWPDGTRRILSVNAAPLAAEGLDARVVCSIVDITAQVAFEDELRRTADRAEAASRAKSQFLANMSHEIRTPLNGVLGMAEVLEGELSNPRQRRMLTTIRESGEMLLGILNDVLDMSKIEAGKLDLETAPLQPMELARRIEAMHGIRAAEKGLALSVDADAGAWAPRLGDAHRIQQILHNLVGNAVKFTEVGGVRITLRAERDGPLEICVTDTGIGMTPDQVARVFEEFEQADGTVTRRFGGTGLGMSIVRRLVGLMGGAVTVDSRVGEGTEVRVVLPLPHAPDPAPSRTAAAPALPAATPGPGSAPREAGEAQPLAGVRALAADDNATNRLILQAMLGSLGMEVTMVHDGRAAVEAWGPARFDVLLLDISMPVLDGVSALAALRGREAEAGVAPAPALAITANALSHQVEEYLAAGFAAHVAKPFRRDDLAKAILRAVSRHDRPDAPQPLED